MEPNHAPDPLCAAVSLCAVAPAILSPRKRSAKGPLTSADHAAPAQGIISVTEATPSKLPANHSLQIHGPAACSSELKRTSPSPLFFTSTSARRQGSFQRPHFFRHKRAILGSASLWLGTWAPLGPKRVATVNPSSLRPAP